MENIDKTFFSAKLALCDAVVKSLEERTVFLHFSATYASIAQHSMLKLETYCKSLSKPCMRVAGVTNQYMLVAHTQPIHLSAAEKGR